MRWRNENYELARFRRAVPRRPRVERVRAKSHGSAIDIGLFRIERKQTMVENYGLPYTGSKSRIAHWVIDQLPRGRVLIDAFAGGCSITHRALLSQKWQTIIANDINGKYPQLFADAVRGKYRDEKRWISREDFERLKSQDAFVACCWSFGNNLNTYMYSKAIEPYKRALHYAIVLDDFAPMQELMPEVAQAVADAIHWQNSLHDRRITAQKVIVKKLKQLTECGVAGDILERLQSLERLERLQSLERLRVTSLSYDEIDIPDDAVVYCDPPYHDRDKKLYECTASSFDHCAFYDWCVRVSKTNPIFISEYSIEDDRFEIVAEKQKITSMAAVKSFNVTERLYTVEK